MDKFHSEIQKLFPADTKIIDCKAESVIDYSATVRLRCTTKEEFKSWLSEHQNLSGNTYRVAVTKPRLGKTVVYKAVYRCQHNTYPTSHSNRVNSASKKHTGCNAKLKVTIKSSTENRVVKSKDCYRGEYPTIVTVLNNHNHGVCIAEAVKFKDPTESVKQKFLDLFRSQHGPSKALDLYKRDLLEEYEDDYYKIAADRSVCPDLQWVFRLYYSNFNKEFGEINNVNFFENLQNYIDNCKSGKLKIIDEDFVIAICTPLMERVHEIHQASHIVFIDSSGNMDRYNCRVFLLMSDSNVGGLPLGIFISSSESEKMITAALELLKSILPTNAFGGAGHNGPSYFLTDDSIAQKKSLENVFPNSIIWLCTFHILQAVWRWLFNSKHKINPDNCKELYSGFKNILIANNKDSFLKSISEFKNSGTVQKYPDFLDYIEQLLVRAETWSLSFRHNNRGQQAGRPKKHIHTEEHGYSRKKVKFGNPTTNFKAPHCLQECVDRNITLGKSH